MGDLSPFEGRDVVGATIAITRAGDGLSEALAVRPAEFHVGDLVHVVLACEVAKVRFDADRHEEDALIRVHVLRAGTATIVDQNLVRGVLDRQADAIARWREQQTGVSRLDLDGDDAE